VSHWCPVNPGVRGAEVSSSNFFQLVGPRDVSAFVFVILAEDHEAVCVVLDFIITSF
jgi:hypothetical protein